MTENISFNYLAILAAAVSTFLLGGIWYAPAVFGTAWMRECGFTEESLRRMGGTGRIFAGSFVLALIMPRTTAGSGRMAGLRGGGFIRLGIPSSGRWGKEQLRLSSCQRDPSVSY